MHRGNVEGAPSRLEATGAHPSGYEKCKSDI
jgi:hypothetical protein